ncbi:MAG: hypothetical protein ACK4UW_21000 [Rhizobium rhizophilum]|uniref:hypothetical protein n=1 Tax=Rhizobium rhizophilum TaxID=1850373 RepID=UPI00391CC975
MTHPLSASWLKMMSLFIVALGLLVALGAHPTTAWPANMLADIVFWPFDDMQRIDTESARVLAAISGGVMVGWAVMIWLVIDRLVPVDPRLARLLLIESTLAWYLVDSTGSFVSGATVNVLLNTVLMLAIVLPAWRIEADAIASTN